MQGHRNFVHGRRTTGKSCQPSRFRANGSRECAPDDRLRTPRARSGGWRFASKKNIKTKRREPGLDSIGTEKALQHGKCDAETYDQRRGAERHYSKSPFRTFFDIRVHVCLRGKACFVPKAARTQTRSDTGLLLDYFPSAWRVSTCPQRKHSKVCLAAGFEVAIMYVCRRWQSTSSTSTSPNRGKVRLLPAPVVPRRGSKTEHEANGVA
jgi:hypothetical protein